MADDRRDKWLAEFRDVGIAKVRSELLLRRWPKEKLSVAREWTEREDARLWQAARGSGPGSPLRRNRKWMAYVIGAVGLGFAAFRAFRIMRHGF